MSNLTTHVANGREYLLIPIPEGANCFNVHNRPAFLYYYATYGVEGDQLPPGNWSIIGHASELSEQDAAEIVELNASGAYKGYDLPFGCSSATESLLSLISSYGMKGETTLILKRQ